MSQSAEALELIEAEARLVIQDVRLGQHLALPDKPSKNKGGRPPDVKNQARPLRLCEGMIAIRTDVAAQTKLKIGKMILEAAKNGS